MAFKEIQDLSAETTVSLGGTNRETGRANPTQVEGYYIGSKDVASKKAKTGFSKLHIIQTPTGNVGVWGKTDLDRKMLSVTGGAMIRITQKGKKAIPGGNDMYLFKVEQDLSNTIDVELPSVTTVEAADEEAYSATESYTSDESTEFFEEPAAVVARPVAPKKPLTSPDANRQAAVKALLSGSRKA